MPMSYASAVIGAEVERVWSLVRDFDALDHWIPAVESSEIEGRAPPIRSAASAT